MNHLVVEEYIGPALETLLLASGRELGLRLTLAHCTIYRPVFSLFKPVNKIMAIISSFTFARLACHKRGCMPCNWRDGLTNLTESGSGSVPFAWREGLAAHILSRLRAARLKCGQELVWTTSFSSCFLLNVVLLQLAVVVMQAGCKASIQPIRWDI